MSVKTTLISFLSILITAAIFSPDAALSANRRVPSQFSSIQKAIDASRAGDRVQVAAGTYFQHIKLKKGVVLEGGWNSGFSHRDPAKYKTVLDGAKEKGPVVIGADGAALDGFTVIHGSMLIKGDLHMGSGIYCKNTSPVIRNNNIRENEPSGIFCAHSRARILSNEIHHNAQAGVFVRKGSDVQIHKNTIHHNKYSGIGSSKLPASKVDARNNVIYSNERSGINIEAASGTIRNNLIYDNGMSGIRGNVMPLVTVNNTVVGNGQAGLFVDDPAAVPDVRNNIFAENNDAGVRTSGKGYAHNLFFANGATGACNPAYLWCVRPQFGGYEDEESYIKAGNIIADPMFKDAKNRNFHLKAASPAIDAGDKNKKFNDAHFPPSMGSDRNDMGAYGGPDTLTEKKRKNHAPVADAGKDREVTKGSKVILEAGGSSDPDGDSLTYNWTMKKAPAGSKAKIAGSNRAKALFVADRPGRYVVRLAVKDRWGLAGKSDTVTITVPKNTPPRAVIGDVLSQVSVGDTLTLYGSASSDRDRDPLTYRWTLASKPAGSHASLQGAAGKECRLRVDAEGCYEVQLVVSDGKSKSEPAVVFISTKNSVTQGVRRVPQEYPTIQAAIEAAQPGDDIIVEKGIYKELITIDKSVNLIGRNWPVIDGGKQDGNKNTISIFYLGDRAGKVEGFIITGGGTGNLGHGINIWDSAPEIYHNRITGNKHGMGIHGSPALTRKTKVHGNLIYGNMVGVGNGKDSNAHIYNNRIYNNSVVGVGARGKALPRIEHNLIYNNRIGIGAREVASPSIKGNRIYNNVDGVVIGPLSTIKAIKFKDILIENNLIAHNSHQGINITSFNKSNVIISNNTIADNNSAERRIRAGGVVLGYPQPGAFSVMLQNNIISGNGTAGVANYIGPENFEKPGVSLKSSSNILWDNVEDFLDCRKGTGDTHKNPSFASTSLKGSNPYKTGIKGAGYKGTDTDFKATPPEI